MLLERLVKATVELQGFRVVTVTGDAGGLVAELAPDRRFVPRCGQCGTRGAYRDGPVQYGASAMYRCGGSPRSRWRCATRRAA